MGNFNEKYLNYKPYRPDQPQHFSITDFYSNYEDIVKHPGPEEKVTRLQSGIIYRFFYMILSVNPSQWLFLALVGLLSALSGALIDSIGSYGKKIKESIPEVIPQPFSFITYALYGLFFAYIAAAVGEYVSKDVEGSGVPEIKTILSGTSIYKYLSFKVMASKFIGLISALTSGFFVGKEGPNIHFAVCIANQLMRIPIFRHFKTNESTKRIMFIASSSAGAVSTFCAPIGGVLLSIELASTSFIVSNLWRSFFCAVFCMIGFKLLVFLGVITQFSFTNYQPISLLSFEMITYAIAGMLSSMFASILVYFLARVSILRNQLRIRFISNRWYYTFSASLIISACCYGMNLFHLGDKKILSDLFSDENIEVTRPYWAKPNPLFNLFFYTATRLFITILSLTCPIPAGVFAPSIMVGAAFGRFVGYFFSLITTVKYVGIYSIIGGITVTATLTHTISICVVIFEINGQISHIVPVLFATLCGYVVGQSLTMSFFDVVALFKDLPYIPSIRNPFKYNKKAKDIMNTSFQYLHLKSDIKEAYLFLRVVKNYPRPIPVVKSRENKMIIYSINSTILNNYILSKYKNIEMNLHEDEKVKLVKIMNNIEKFSSKQIKEKQTKEINEENELKIIISQPIQNENDNLIRTNAFLHEIINFEEIGKEIDITPFCVLEETSTSRIHFLFATLNLSQIYVINEGVLVGLITKNDFLRKFKLEN